MARKVRNLSGLKFGRLTVEKYYGKNKRGKALWICRCCCGNKKIVIGGALTTGHTKSCGCLNREISIKIHTKHGLYKHPLYRVWAGMLQRCYNKQDSGYKWYGYRNIKVCNNWKNNFKIFYNWAIFHKWKKGLQIDRINTNGDYSPSNCRIATPRQNSSNKRYKRKLPIGVYKSGKKYIATINLGAFKTPKEASIFRNITIRRMSIK